MTKEDKELLLKELCARLPYYLIVHVEHNTCGFIENADLQVYGYEGKLKLLREDNETFCYLPIEEVKPYLRPMSSMTEEEQRILDSMCYGVEMVSRLDGLKMFDKAFNFLNSHHLDYHELIDKGLAIEVTEENNPYK